MVVVDNAQTIELYKLIVKFCCGCVDRLFSVKCFLFVNCMSGGRSIL